MDILEKINKLRKDRGWSIYKLADEALITQSTLANMFTRQSTPSIQTLQQICNAFNMTLSEFFNEEENFELKTEEKAVLNKYKKLQPNDQKIILDLLDLFIKNKK